MRYDVAVRRSVDCIIVTQRCVDSSGVSTTSHSAALVVHVLHAHDCVIACIVLLSSVNVRACPSVQVGSESRVTSRSTRRGVCEPSISLLLNLNVTYEEWTPQHEAALRSRASHSDRVAPRSCS